MSLAQVLKRSKAFLTPRSSSASIVDTSQGFRTASESQLFPKGNPAVDGEDCDHDCASCEVQLPKNFKIEEQRKLYGEVKEWATHMLVATGKTDWVKEVTNEKGSVMEAMKECNIEPSNGKLMLSASNIPVQEEYMSQPASNRPTTVLLLPSFTFVDSVTPTSVKDLINLQVSPSRTNMTPMESRLPAHEKPSQTGLLTPDSASETVQPVQSPLPSPFSTRPCQHKYLILLCSHKTRDARCGQSAPLIKRELERQLRPLCLYRDLHDERPGGVGIYFISHVGGHKFAANMMIYRRTEGEDGLSQEASQCIWLARVRPEDCEGIVKFTVLQGKVVKPERQLRGGFDREKGLVSW